MTYLEWETAWKGGKIKQPLGTGNTWTDDIPGEKYVVQVLGGEINERHEQGEEQKIHKLFGCILS